MKNFPVLVCLLFCFSSLAQNEGSISIFQDAEEPFKIMFAQNNNGKMAVIHDGKVAYLKKNKTGLTTEYETQNQERLLTFLPNKNGSLLIYHNESSYTAMEVDGIIKITINTPGGTDPNRIRSEDGDLLAVPPPSKEKKGISIPDIPDSPDTKTRKKPQLVELTDGRLGVQFESKIAIFSIHHGTLKGNFYNGLERKTFLNIETSWKNISLDDKNYYLAVRDGQLQVRKERLMEGEE